MNFQVGDSVMHWTYGLGEVVGLEERDLFGKNSLYYAVQIDDLTVWVPADDELDSRLRTPTAPAEFKKLFSILTSQGEPLPEDRLERKTELSVRLKDGRAESLCLLIRDLFCYGQARRLNDHDIVVMNRAREALIAEWGLVLSILPNQAASELERLLNEGHPALIYAPRETAKK